MSAIAEVIMLCVGLLVWVAALVGIFWLSWLHGRKEGLKLEVAELKREYENLLMIIGIIEQGLDLIHTRYRTCSVLNSLSAKKRGQQWHQGYLAAIEDIKNIGLDLTVDSATFGLRMKELIEKEGETAAHDNVHKST